MCNLQDKCVIVTGSSHGIGYSIAKIIAREGAHVAINCRQNVEEAEKVALEIRALGRNSIVVQADVTDLQQVRSMTDTVVNKWGRVDVLVTNVGHAYYHQIDRLNPELWHQSIEENLTSQMYCIQASLPYMIKQGRGRVIAISSISAQRGSPSGDIGYSASKAAIIAMIKTLAQQYASQQITFNAVLPGIIDAGLTNSMPLERRELLIESIPMRRLGKPDEIGEAVAFLASDQASYITGQAIAVNGGLYM
ncbi:MAG TPA: 3-oxoacyl-ACP reductase [Anaerolineaceae bacterium]|nr:3-oxoacyl-ACP reductase [Anaerolineaceae bacterium]